MRLLLKIENHTSLPNGQPLVRELNRSGLQIGRAADVDWQLPDPKRLISSIHAEIKFRDGAYWLRDKSGNGTFVNGVRIDTPNREVELRDGDRIAIGHYELAAQIQGEAAQATSPSTSDAGVWAIDDWSNLGTPAAPVPVEVQRTPVRSSESVLSSAFDAPRMAPLSDSSGHASSWEDWGTPEATPPAAPRMEQPRESPPERPVPARERVAGPTPPPARPTSPTVTLGSDESSQAMAAFLRGAGLPADGVLVRNPAAMEQAGRTLRVLVAGLFGLLKHHGEMKSVLGVERTTIRLADNNTFKFSTSPDDAMMRLMMPRESDLPGPAAAERSLDDIRRHEERLLTAMNDAVRHILERLSPIEIKRRETGGVMDMFIPGARKASWWDELEREYATLKDNDGAKLDELIEDELRNAFGRHL